MKTLKRLIVKITIVGLLTGGAGIATAPAAQAHDSARVHATRYWVWLPGSPLPFIIKWHRIQRYEPVGWYGNCHYDVVEYIEHFTGANHFHFPRHCR